MSEKKLSKEQIEALQKCKTKEEVAKFAQENQLTDEELEKVVGGDFKRLFRMFQKGGSGHTTLNMDIMN